MEASIVDLRYRTKEILRALERNEEVRILYRGRMKGRIVPDGGAAAPSKVEDHPYFGSAEDAFESVEACVDKLRRGRY